MLGPLPMCLWSSELNSPCLNCIICKTATTLLQSPRALVSSEFSHTNNVEKRPVRVRKCYTHLKYYYSYCYYYILPNSHIFRLSEKQPPVLLLFFNYCSSCVSFNEWHSLILYCSFHSKTSAKFKAQMPPRVRGIGERESF